MQTLQKGDLPSVGIPAFMGSSGLEGVVTELTSGTFTLLWSAIEGSTQLLEQLATSMSSSWQGTSACGDPRVYDLGAERSIDLRCDPKRSEVASPALVDSDRALWGHIRTDDQQ